MSAHFAASVSCRSCCMFVLIFICVAEAVKPNYTTLKLVRITQGANVSTSATEATLEDAESIDDTIIEKIANHSSWEFFEEDCGENNVNRIIGGHNAALGEHPWIARLGRYKITLGITGPVEWFCAGSLITKSYVITAAHCTMKDAVKLVRFGEYDSNSALDCTPDGYCATPPQDRIPLEVINHPGFTTGVINSPYDISLILLSKPVDLNEWVEPICLPKTFNPEFVSGNADVIGWGMTIAKKSASIPSILQTVSLKIIKSADCKSILSGVPKGTFCAGGSLNLDSCNGDSGGPLLKVSELSGSPRYYLLGAVSYGATECGNGEPGVYTNITYHLPWILDHMKKQE